MLVVSEDGEGVHVGLEAERRSRWQPAGRRGERQEERHRQRQKHRSSNTLPRQRERREQREKASHQFCTKLQSGRRGRTAGQVGRFLHGIVGRTRDGHGWVL